MNASQLVERNPAEQGADKPTVTPSEMFAKPAAREETRDETIARLLSWIDDDSTIDDW